MIRAIRAIRSRPVVAAVLVTAVSLAVIGVAIVTLTSAGCGAARFVGLIHVGSRCLAEQQVALRSTPTPSSLPTTPQPASPTAPYNPPASAPYYPPASAPYYPPASAYPPGGSQGSGYPFYPGASTGDSRPPVQLSCSLPVYAGPPGSGGFVTFPGGNFIADPKSSVSQPSPPGQASPLPPGYGYGYAGLAYDRKFSRWLPVQHRWVSPDGDHYAFLSSNSIYVVTVATNVLTEIGEGKNWYIIDVRDDGVYAGVPNSAGLWVLPYSGSPRQITSSGYWQAVWTGAAYGTSTSAVPQGADSTIIRLDLSTGTTTDWFTQSGQQSLVVGFQGPNPIIFANGPQGQSVWISSGANTATLVTVSTNGPYGFNAYGNPIADSNGVWFTGSWNGRPVIALFMNSAIYGMSTLGGQLAGGCS